MLPGNRPPQLDRLHGLQGPSMGRLILLHRPGHHGPSMDRLHGLHRLHRPGHHGPRCTGGRRTTHSTGVRQTTLSTGGRRGTAAVTMEDGLQRRSSVPRVTEMAIFQPGHSVRLRCADSAGRTSLPHTASSRVSCVVCAASSTDAPQASGARSTSILKSLDDGCIGRSTSIAQSRRGSLPAQLRQRMIRCAQRREKHR